MSKGKRNVFAVLLTAILAFIFAALLCLGFPVAEAHAEGTTRTVSSQEELENAFKEAQDGDTITLGENITLSECVVISRDDSSGVNITLDLNGKTIDLTETFKSEFTQQNGKLAGGVAIRVYGNITLTVSGNGTFDGSAATNADEKATEINLFSVQSGATLQIESGNYIIDDDSGACVYAFADSHVVINGGTFQNKSVEDYPYADGGLPLVVNQANVSEQLVTINGGTFVGRNPILGDDNVGGTFVGDEVNMARTSNGDYVAYKGGSVPAGASVTYTYSGVTGVTATVYNADGLTEAVAQDYSTVMLGADITQSITVSAGRELTLDLNGHTLTAAAADKNAVVSNYGTLTIVNTDTANMGAIQSIDGSTWYTVFNEGMMTIGAEGEGYGELEVKTNSVSSPASLVENNYDCSPEYPAMLTIFSGTFTSIGNSSNAVKNDDYGVCTISGGTFTNEAEGGSVVMSAGTMTISDGTFEQKYVPTVQTTANAVRNASDDEKIVITGGTFTGNLLNNDAAGFVISGGRFDRTFNAEFLAEGAALYMPESGEKYVAVSTEPIEGMNKVVVYSGGVGYTSLQAAINADGTEVGLVSDITELVTVPSTVNIRIRMNGYTLTAENDSEPVITVEGALTWVNVAGEVVSNTGVLVKDGGSITIEAAPVITFTGTTNLTVEEGGSASVANGIFNGAIVNNGGSIKLSGGTYANKPESDWLAGGYGAIVNESGTYAVAQLIAEMTYTQDGQQITEGFSSWDAMLIKFNKLDGQEGEIAITIYRAIPVGSESLTVKSGMTVTVNLNGKGFNTGFINYGNLTLEGSTSGFVSGDVANKGGGKLTLEGGKYGKSDVTITITDETTDGNGITVYGGAFVGGALMRSILPYVADGYCFTSITNTSSNSISYGTIGNAKALVEVKDGAYTLQCRSLAAANAYARFSAVDESVMLTLLDDVSNGSLMFGGSTGSAATAWTIDLGGNTLTCSYGFTFGANDYPVVFTVQGGTILFTKGGTSRYAVTVNYGSTLILNDVNIEFASETPFADMINVAGGSTLNIESGSYYGGITRTKGIITIAEGCVFDDDITEFLDGGLTQNGSGMVVPQESADDVAMIKTETGIVYYATLQAAINAAADGETVKLLDNVTLSETLKISNGIVLDLSGKTITSNVEEPDPTQTHAAIFYNGQKNFTIQNGTLVSEGTAIELQGTSMMGRATVTLAEDFKIQSQGVGVYAHGGLKLITSAAITAHSAAIQTHGSLSGITNINVTGGSLTSTNSVAMYLPQKNGTINISGGTITGTTGIEIRNGMLNITGGTIVATGTDLSTAPNGSGSTVNAGAAVAVSKYAGNINSLKVNISGGKLQGAYAVYEENLNADGAEIDVSKLSISLTGGTFDGDVASENVTGFISGGKFSEQIDADYLAEDCAQIASGETFTVGTEETLVSEQNAVAKIEETGVAYTTLQNAINAAAGGETVTLLADIDNDYAIIRNSLNLDLNGYTLTSTTSTGNAFITIWVVGSTQDNSDRLKVSIYSSREGGAIVQKSGSSNSRILYAYGAVDLTIKDIALESKDEEAYGLVVGSSADSMTTKVTVYNVNITGSWPAVYMNGSGNADRPSEFIAYNSYINSDYVGIMGYGEETQTDENGTQTWWQTYIELNDTVVTVDSRNADLDTAAVKKGIGIYHPQGGTLVINGGSVTGVASAVEMRVGTLRVNGAILSSTSKIFSSSAEGSGWTTAGAAVVVSQHSTQKPISISIDKGTLNGIYSLYETDTIDSDTPSEDVEISVVGGIYNGKVYSENITGFISGGQFAMQPAEDYMDPDYVAEYHDGYFVPVESSALRAAQANAQADVREYAASLGITWSDVVTAASDSASANYATAIVVINLYNAIAETTSEKGVAEARLDVMDAVELYAAFITDAEKINTARLNAQADVREYAATLGIILEELTAVAEENTLVGWAAKELLDEYNKIIVAADEGAVAEAKLAAIKAADAYSKAVKAAFEDYKEERISDELNPALEGKEGTDDDVVLPTATWFALNHAATQAEFNKYLANAVAEVTAIRSLRTEISKQTQQLGSLATTLESMGDMLFGDTETDTEGEFEKLLTGIKRAISDAQSAIVNGEESSTSLSSIQEYLTKTINGALTEIKNALNHTETGLSAIKNALDSLDVSDDLKEEFDSVIDAITAAQDAITGSTDGVGGTSIGDAIDKINTATAGYVNGMRNALIGENGTGGVLGTIAGYVDDLESMLNGNSGLAAIVADIKEAKEAIMGVTEADEDGVNLSEVLTEVRKANTAVESALAKMNETLAAWQQTVAGYEGTLAWLETALGDGEGSLYDRINIAITAAQDAITGSTDGVGGTSIGDAIESLSGELEEVQKAILDAMLDYSQQLTAISGSIEALQTLLNGNSGLAAIKTELDSVVSAIGSATDGDTSASGLFALLEAIQSGNSSISSAVTALQDALLGTDNNGAIANLTNALEAAQDDLDSLTGALLEANGGLSTDITDAFAEIDRIVAAIGSLGTAEGSDLATQIGGIVDSLEEVQGTVGNIAESVDASTTVETAKETAFADVETWINAYLDNILTVDGEAGSAVAALAYTAETTEGDIYAKLAQAFSEDNAKLVLRYYNDALAAIDAATTVSEVTTAVSTFKAQVASVEAAAQNVTDVDLTGVYVLLAVAIVLIVAAVVVLLLKGRKESASTVQMAENRVAQPEETPAAEAPVQTETETEPSAEEELAAEDAADDDKDRIVIAANVRSFSEAYMDLDEKQRELFTKVKDYALAKEGAVEVSLNSGVCIKREGKQIVKLTVRRNLPVALFLLENEMLKDFRRSVKSETKLKVRATELAIRDEEDLQTAYTMVDLSIDQIEKDIEAAKERRREARRQRRLQRQAEKMQAQSEEAGAAESQPSETEADDEE